MCRLLTHCSSQMLPVNLSAHLLAKHFLPKLFLCMLEADNWQEQMWVIGFISLCTILLLLGWTLHCSMKVRLCNSIHTFCIFPFMQHPWMSKAVPGAFGCRMVTGTYSANRSKHKKTTNILTQDNLSKMTPPKIGEVKRWKVRPSLIH